MFFDINKELFIVDDYFNIYIYSRRIIYIVDELFHYLLYYLLYVYIKTNKMKIEINIKKNNKG